MEIQKVTWSLTVRFPSTKPLQRAGVSRRWHSDILGWIIRRLSPWTVLCITRLYPPYARTTTHPQPRMSIRTSSRCLLGVGRVSSSLAGNHSHRVMQRARRGIIPHDCELTSALFLRNNPISCSTRMVCRLMNGHFMHN